MSKLTKQLEYQQRINQEAQKLMKHFGEEVDLKCYYMRMAKTQAQVFDQRSALSDACLWTMGFALIIEIFLNA